MSIPQPVKLRLWNDDLESIDLDLIVLGCWQADDGTVRLTDDRLSPDVKELIFQNNITGAFGEIVLVADAKNDRQFLIVALGPKSKSLTLDDWCLAFKHMQKAVARLDVTSVAIDVDSFALPAAATPVVIDALFSLAEKSENKREYVYFLATRPERHARLLKTVVQHLRTVPDRVQRLNVQLFH